MTPAAPVIVWFLMAWTSGRTIPVQYGPFGSEGQCMATMAIIEEEHKRWGFLRAGWHKCGITKWNKLIILERLP